MSVISDQGSVKQKKSSVTKKKSVAARRAAVFTNTCCSPRNRNQVTSTYFAAGRVSDIRLKTSSAPLVTGNRKLATTACFSDSVTREKKSSQVVGKTQRAARYEVCLQPEVLPVWSSNQVASAGGDFDTALTTSFCSTGYSALGCFESMHVVRAPREELLSAKR